MAIICWGNLAKAADETTRIEESISDYVERHDENVNAHQVYGSSLYMHRIQDELDHKFGSVDFKWLALNKILVNAAFESFDGWYVDATTEIVGVLGSGIATSAIANNEAFMTLEPGGILELEYSKNPFFQTTVKLSRADDLEVSFGCGREKGSGDLDSFGFYFVNGTEYVYWTKDPTTYTQVLSNIVTTDRHVYRAVFDNDAGNIKFYVDGELVYTATENLPSTTNSFVFTYWVKTTENVIKYLYFMDFLFMLDR